MKVFAHVAIFAHKAPEINSTGNTKLMSSFFASPTITEVERFHVEEKALFLNRLNHCRSDCFRHW